MPKATAARVESASAGGRASPGQRPPNLLIADCLTGILISPSPRRGRRISGKADKPLKFAREAYKDALRGVNYSI
jgi:hypothetical protein